MTTKPENEQVTLVCETCHEIYKPNKTSTFGIQSGCCFGGAPIAYVPQSQLDELQERIDTANNNYDIVRSKYIELTKQNEILRNALEKIYSELTDGLQNNVTIPYAAEVAKEALSKIKK